LDKESVELLSKLLTTLANDIANNSKRISALEKTLKDHLPAGFGDAYRREMDKNTTLEKDALFLGEIRKLQSKIVRGLKN
jgi:hypothetical protein